MRVRRACRRLDVRPGTPSPPDKPAEPAFQHVWPRLRFLSEYIAPDAPTNASR